MELLQQNVFIVSKPFLPPKGHHQTTEGQLSVINKGTVIFYLVGIPDFFLSLSVLTAIFQVNLGYPVFIEAKDDGGGSDNRTTGAISRAKLQSNHHHQSNIQFFTGRMPFLSPNQQCQSTEGKIWTCSPKAHMGHDSHEDGKEMLLQWQKESVVDNFRIRLP